jgi:hypothetical protein
LTVVVIARRSDLSFNPGAAPGGQIEGYARPAARTTADPEFNGRLSQFAAQLPGIGTPIIGDKKIFYPHHSLARLKT